MLHQSRTRVVSELTRIECHRAFIRNIALRRLSRQRGVELNERANTFGNACELMQFDSATCARARGEFPGEPIRSLDALHLGFFQVALAALPDLVMVSLDQRLRTVAHRLGYPLAPA